MEITQIHLHAFLQKLSKIFRQIKAVNVATNKTSSKNGNFVIFGAKMRKKIFHLQNLEGPTDQNQLKPLTIMEIEVNYSCPKMVNFWEEILPNGKTFVDYHFFRSINPLVVYVFHQQKYFDISPLI